MRSPEVIVVGVGAVGAATCAALARRGVRVLGLDRSTIPNASSSHHGDSRVFRVAYAEHPDYVVLLKRAKAAWQALEEEEGSRLLHLCGVLYLGPRGCELVAATTAAAEAHGVPHRRLSRAEVLDTYPQFAIPEDYVAVSEPGAGWVEAEAGVTSLASRARALGADLRAGEPIVGWSADSRGVTVHTAAGEHSADRLVLCAGAWSGRLLGDLDLPLRVTRQGLCWTRPAEPSRFDASRFPVWAIQSPHGFGYGFPRAAGSDAVKSAIHLPGEPTDPDEPRGAASEGEIEAVRRVLEHHVPGALGPVARSCACMYTNTPDGHFVLDRHPEHGRVVFGCGFSGHGFKFAPVIGEALADLAMRGETEIPIGFLGLDRFRGRSDEAT